MLNRGARDPRVLTAALERFGCCDADHLRASVQTLLSRGRVDLPVGHTARLVAFGTLKGHAPVVDHHVVSLTHVVRFLEDYVRSHWDTMRHAAMKDPVLGHLALVEKARRGQDDSDSGPSSGRRDRSEGRNP